jgi:uncharacterized protein YdeI (BOF family)
MLILYAQTKVNLMRKLKIILLFSALLSISNLGFAQDDFSFSNQGYFTVGEISRNATSIEKNNMMVKTRGYIIQRLSSETFFFRDDTGIIRVRIPKDLQDPVYFNDKIELVITGTVNYTELRCPVIIAKVLSRPSF